MSSEKQVVYLIVDESGLYFNGVECGCAVWKNHKSRAAFYQTSKAAEKDVTYFGLDGDIVEVEVWW